MSKPTKQQLEQQVLTMNRVIADLRKKAAKQKQEISNLKDQLVFKKIHEDLSNAEMKKAFAGFLMPDETRADRLQAELDEVRHSLESLLDGVRQTLLTKEGSAMYDTHYTLYYALWYWVEFGTRCVKGAREKKDE